MRGLPGLLGDLAAPPFTAPINLARATNSWPPPIPTLGRANAYAFLPARRLRRNSLPPSDCPIADRHRSQVEHLEPASGRRIPSGSQRPPEHLLRVGRVALQGGAR